MIVKLHQQQKEPKEGQCGGKDVKEKSQSSVKKQKQKNTKIDILQCPAKTAQHGTKIKSVTEVLLQYYIRTIQSKPKNKTL